MRRKVRERRGTVTATLLASALTAALAAGCSSPGGRDDSRAPDTRQPSTPAEATTPPAPPVLAVKIDNVPAAKPQTGLDAADIVYVEQVEAGLTRLMAVYATELPETVGPVRSARESDLELLRQFPDPTLAFSGAQSKLLPLIDQAPLDAQPPERTAGAYFRSPNRPAPHNLYLRPDRLMPSAPGAEALTVTGFRYGDAPLGGTADTSETVRYPATRFTFTWSEKQEGWQVAQDGRPTVTSDGERITPATVVVQYVPIRKSEFHDYLGNYTPYTETVGSGRAKVLRDGRAYDVEWKRPTAEDGTEFTTADGDPVNFAEGQVWVVFAKAG
ncbi:DUF3048 domain-containing protein [Streptomyces sp. NPDC054829]